MTCHWGQASEGAKWVQQRVLAHPRGMAEFKGLENIIIIRNRVTGSVDIRRKGWRWALSEQRNILKSRPWRSMVNAIWPWKQVLSCGVDPCRGVEMRTDNWGLCIARPTITCKGNGKGLRLVLDAGAWKERRRLIGWEIYKGWQVVVWRLRAWTWSHLLCLWEKCGGIVEDGLGGQG